MVRPYWSGQIQISLVAFGVHFYVATESKSQISFHQISRSTGERVRHQKVLESATESSNDDPAPAVGKDEIVKGYEYEKGHYIIIEPEELANLRVPSKHVIEVSQFVDLEEIKPEYVEKPYFVTPENDAQAEAFAVVRKALQKTDKFAVGKVAFSGREHIIAIGPAGDESSAGMIAYTLRYPDELRQQSDYFRDIKKTKIGEESLELAEALIAKRSSKLDLSKFQDGYEVAVRELVDAKLHKQAVPKDEGERPSRGNVVNLMDALRKSIASGRASADARQVKKPVASVTGDSKRGIGLVKSSGKASVKRKSA